MDFPKRKSNRLQNYNYSQYGAYFITICTEGKNPLLCRIRPGTVVEPPAVILSRYGEIVQQKIRSLPGFYPGVEIEKFVIMPNHIHMILSLNTDTDASQTPANHKLPALISAFKRFTNRESGISLWQRSYYDHVIRNDRDYQNIWKYIDDNPAKWMEDRFYVPE